MSAPQRRLGQRICGQRVIRRQLSTRQRGTRLPGESLEDRRLLAVFPVNSLLDTVDVLPGDGIAADAAGNTSLRAAVMEAGALAGADTITLGAGNYLFTRGGSGDASLGDLNITSADLLTIEGVDPLQTTIDAGLVDRLFAVEYHSALALRNLTLTGGASLEGGAIHNRGLLTIENSRLVDNVATYRGGAINVLNEAASTVGLTLNNVEFTNNRTTATSASGAPLGLGGAIYLGAATATITDCRFSDNVGSMQAGAIYAASATVTINESTFSGNTAGDGGALRLYAGTVTINDTTFVGQRAQFSGGAILSTGTDLTINRGDFADNQTTHAGDYLATVNGGAIAFFSGGNSRIDGTEFRENSSWRGGAVFVYSARVTIYNSLFENNTALKPAAASTAGRGGGVMVDSNGVFNAFNSTFVGNSADEGGAVFVTSTTTLANNTISGNVTHSTSSGAVHNSIGSFTVTNNIIAGNADHRDVHGHAGSWGGNIIGVLGTATGFVATDRSGTAASPLNPLLQPLAENGGPTRTVAIASQSLARDFCVVNGLTMFTDARGLPRSGLSPDAGAYEFQNNPVTATAFMGTTDEDTVLHGQLQGVDSDGDALTFETSPANYGTLTSQPDGQFTYTPPADAFGTAVFWIRARDGHGSVSAWVECQITVLPVNDPPTVADQTFSLDENLPSGTFVGGITARDLEFNYPLWAEVASGNEQGLFHFDGISGGIWINNHALLDFETQTSHSFVVRVHDALGASATATITINLNDIAIPTVERGFGNVQENAANGSWVNQIYLKHRPEPGQTLKYLLVSDPSGGAFQVDEDFGTVTVADNSFLDYETARTHLLTVRAYDSANPGLFSEAIFEVTVHNANEAPSIQDQSFTVAENTANGTAVGSVVATDVDSGQTLTYAISSSSLNGAFAIDALSGQIRVADRALLDFETVTSVDLTIQASDNGSVPLSSSATITIHLTDVAEAAPIAAISGPTTGVRNQDLSFTLTATQDGQAPDALFAFALDWDGDGNADETISGPTGTTVAHAFPASGVFNVKVVATGAGGLVSEASALSISIVGPYQEGSTLFLGGTSNDDLLVITPSSIADAVTVVLNNVNLGSFAAVRSIVAYGGLGTDKLILNGTGLTESFSILESVLVWHGITANTSGITVLGNEIETQRINAQAGNDQFTHVAGTAELDGGTGTDQLIGADGNNDWLITGSNLGTLNGLAFANVESLTGGSQADHFLFVGAGKLTGVLNGGAGTDTLNYSFANGPVAINWATQKSTGTSGIASIESIIGSNQADTLTGLSTQANTWNLTGLRSGDLNGGPTFSEIENLTGGSQTDEFVFTPAASGFGTINGGSGSDTLNYSQWFTSITVNNHSKMAPGLAVFASIEKLIGTGQQDTLVGLNATTTWTINGPDQGTAGTLGFTSFENLMGGSLNDSFKLTTATAAVSGLIVGGPGVDTVTGFAQANTWHLVGQNHGYLNGVQLFLDIENLTGGSQADEFFFTVDAGGFGTVNGGSGSDTLNYSQFSVAMDVNHQTKVAPALTLYASIESVVGGSGPDVLVGLDANSTWSITGADEGVAGSLQFSAFEHLVGGSLNDNFKLTTAASSISGWISGGPGVNTVSGFAQMNTWNLVGQRVGNLNGALVFFNIENLTGGSQADEFVFTTDADGFGTVNGGSGSDTLNYSQLVGSISIQQQLKKAPALALYASIENVIGGSGQDALFGADANTAWTITGPDQGSAGSLKFSSFENLFGGSLNDAFKLTAVNGAISGGITGGDGLDTLTGANMVNQWQVLETGSGTLNGGIFSGLENLVGGTLNDHFAFAASAQLLGSLNGGTGVNTIDYGAWTAGVSVNLASSATVIGQVTAVTNFVSNISMVRGGSGDDVLRAAARNSILLGGAGNDQLFGSTGRDLLFGGEGSDSLSGGAGDDILLGGVSLLEDNDAALLGLLAEWSTTSRNYATRTANLRGVGSGTRLNDDWFLEPGVNVLDDDASDTLLGEAAADWFFAGEGDLLGLGEPTAGERHDLI